MNSDPALKKKISNLRIHGISTKKARKIEKRFNERISKSDLSVLDIRKGATVNSFLINLRK